MRFNKSVSLSLGVHLLFFLICALWATQRQPLAPTRHTTLIELEPYKKNQEKESQPNQRIVQTSKAEKTKKAAPDAFLGEQTQTVDRQTVSRDRMIQMGQAKVTRPPKTVSAQSEKAQPEVAKPMTPHTAAIPLQNLGLAILPSMKKMEDMAKEKKRDRVGDEFVTPSEQAPQDYIKGMKDGEATALNTREFMFYGYYQRIRERLDRAWVPLLRANVASLYNHGRRLASEMDYSTKIMVVMNSGGEIIKIQVLTESGTSDLDDAAVQAFNKAGPFPNPPHGIVDSSGEIKIPWEFVLRT